MKVKAEKSLQQGIALYLSGKRNQAAGMQASGRLKKRERNGLECEYEQYLHGKMLAGEIIWYEFEAVKLVLADNTSYTPDFAVMRSDGLLEMHEVKGRWMDDARVKIKVAARLFPFAFIAIQKQRGGGWSFEYFS